MMKSLAILVTLGALLMLSPHSQAQMRDREARINDTLEMVKTIVRANRQEIVTATMQLTTEESEAFWPVYREYRNDIEKILDRRITLIKDFAKEYGKLSADTAEDMLTESLDIDGDLLRVKKRYVKKFKKVLPPIKVTRFYQVENKLDAVVAVQLAQDIPFVK